MGTTQYRETSASCSPQAGMHRHGYRRNLRNTDLPVLFDILAAAQFEVGSLIHVAARKAVVRGHDRVPRWSPVVGRRWRPVAEELVRHTPGTGSSAGWARVTSLLRAALTE